MSGPVIALAAGGTGGHVFPAQAVAQALAGRGYSPILLTDRRGANYAASAPDLPTHVLPAATLAGGLVAKLGAVKTIGQATLRAVSLLRREQARLVIGFGGYPSFAPCIAAKLTGRPVMLAEQATRFSLANRKLLPLASAVALSFPIQHEVMQQPRTRVVGPAVRPVIAAVAGTPCPAMTGPIELLVVGGSQGAKIFGETVPPALEHLPDALRSRLRLSLQYAGEDGAAVQERLAKAGIAADIAPFFHDMADRLVRAHLIICRAGASTAADLTTVGRPAIFVPIPVGGSTDEQRENAQSFERAGAGWYMPQRDLEQGALTAKLLDLLEGDHLPDAAKASAALGRSDGAQAMADFVGELVPLR